MSAIPYLLPKHMLGFEEKLKLNNGRAVFFFHAFWYSAEGFEDAHKKKIEMLARVLKRLPDRVPVVFFEEKKSVEKLRDFLASLGRRDLIIETGNGTSEPVQGWKPIINWLSGKGVRCISLGGYTLNVCKQPSLIEEELGQHPKEDQAFYAARKKLCEETRSQMPEWSREGAVQHMRGCIASAFQNLKESRQFEKVVLMHALIGPDRFFMRKHDDLRRTENQRI